jgi:chromosome segregation ATPase
MAKGLTSLLFLSVFVCSVILVGCQDKRENKEKAEAELLVPKLERELAKAKSHLKLLSDELEAVKQMRDQLEQQVRNLTAAHDDAVKQSETADQNVDELNRKINKQSERISYLENEINVLNSVVEEQRATIAEQQGTIAELVTIIEQQPVEGEQVIPEEQQEVVE